jgi:hypothetical protein
MRQKVHPAVIAAMVLCACNTAVVPPPDPAQIVVLKDAPEITTPGGTIAEISVRVLSSSGHPVPGQLVEWQGDGEVVAADSRTDELGIATARWILPQWPEFSFLPHGPSGTHRAYANASGLSNVEFVTTTRAFQVDQFDAAFHVGCGVKSGDLWCWGSHGFDSPGSGDRRRPSRVDLGTGVSASEVAVTDREICFVDQQGYVHCKDFGPDGFAAVTGLPPSRALLAGSPAYERGWYCGLARVDNAAWCWTNGQSPIPPYRVSPMSFGALAVSHDFACGLNAGGVAWCWGNNDHGQLGDGSTASSATPVRVVGAPPFLSLSAGGAGVCGATATREVWCWGGPGPLSIASQVPVRVSLAGVVGNHVYVSKSGDGYVIDDGRLTVWYGRFTEKLFSMTDRASIRRVAGGGQMCVQTISMELFCSWILLIGGGDTSIFPSDLLPLPDPMSPADS